MTIEQKNKVIKELENYRDDAILNEKKSNCLSDECFYCGEILAYQVSINTIKQTTVNRSSSEPKIIEG